MSRKDNTPGKELDKLIQKEIRNAVADEMADQSTLPPEEAYPAGIPIMDMQEDPELEKILASFPSDKGYYGKLYRKNISGQLEFKYFLDHLEDVDDPELYIAQLISEQKWRGGEYVLRIMKKNEAGCAKIIRWNMAMDEKTSSAEPQIAASGPMNEPMGLAQAISVMKSINEISNSNPAQMQKTIAETFTSGMEAAKGLLPSGAANTGFNMESIMKNIIPMIALLKELGIIQPKVDNTIEMFKLMKEMGVIKAPSVAENPQQGLKDNLSLLKDLGLLKTPGQEDKSFLQQLAVLRELGLAKIPSEDDSKNTLMKQISDIKELMTIINPGEAGEPASPLNQIISILGPKVPEMIHDITSTTGKFMDLQKAKMSAGTQQIVQPVQQPHIAMAPPANHPTMVSHDSPHVGPTSSPTTTSGQPAQSGGYEQPIQDPTEAAQQQPTLDEYKINIFLTDLKEHILSGRDEFDSMYNGLLYTFKGQFIQQYQAGLLTVPMLMEMLQQRDPIFSEAAAATYIERFFAWIDDLVKPRVYKCSSCGTQVDLTPVEFKDDPICTECGGVLIEAINVVGGDEEIVEAGDNHQNTEELVEK
jgi:DNA-directed RNA polymerase subunit RPC12/RpoP